METNSGQRKTAARADAEQAGRLIIGGGEVGDLVRSTDWAETPLGPVEAWPASLRTMVNLALGSEVPMFVLWGPELVQVYNHGARLVLGTGKHPAAMGQRARDCWKEIWDVLWPMYQQALAGGSTLLHDSPLLIDRRGFLEECYFEHAYTPIRDESAAVAGLLATVAETTDRVLGARRLACLRELGRRTALADDAPGVIHAAAEVLAANGADLPFVLLYARRGDSAELLLRTGLPEESPAAPASCAQLSLCPWPLAEVLEAGVGRRIDSWSERLGELHAGPWPEALSRAMLVPLALGGSGEKDGVMVVGLSPRLAPDQPYDDFIGQLVRQLAAALARIEASVSSLQARERYRTLFASIDDGFCLIQMILGPEGEAVDYRFLEANASFEAQTGLRNPVGRTARELVPLLDAFWFRLYGRVAETGEATRFENQASAMEGRWFDGYASRVGAAARREVAIVFKDVTERKRHEEQRAELLAWEQRARAEAEAERQKQHELFMQAPVAICMLEGAQHLFTFANAPYRALVQGRDVVGKTLHEALPDVKEQGFDRLLDQVMATGESFVATEMPIQLEHHVGEERLYLSFTYTPMRSGAGEIAGVLASAVDMTESVLARRRVELLARQVQLSEGELRLAIDAIPFLVSFVTVDERFGIVNSAYEEWFGLGREMLLGRTIRDVIGEAGYAVYGPYIRRGLSGEQLSFEHHDVPHRRGGIRDVKVTIIPRRDAAGVVQGYLSIVEDITERGRAERERALLLAREQEARRQAEEASRLKDDFLATVSHELRTPLTSILGWVQMLRSGAVPPERQPRALETIERNARSQAQLIDDLLDISRILAGKLALEIQPLDVSSVVEAALESMRPTAQTKGIRLQPALDSSGLVMGDPNRLQQVVWNLLTNAVKFTPKGGRVQILVQCLESAVELTVADTGQGIPAEFLPHVFERFRQSDGSITRSKGGLGLGLSIVRQLVEMHGGTITASSEGEGKGATFVVRLPLSVTRRRESDLPGPRSFPPSPSPPRQELAGLRLLVVDDEEDTREMLCIMLEASGASVRRAASADEGRRAVATERPDVVVSDIGMPGENGYAFLESLRRLFPSERGDLPVVALTAYARSEDRTRALQAGFASHVAKPVEPTELVAVIASLARQGRGR